MNNNFFGPPGYFIVTFGCQMNERDSESLAGIMENKGYVPAGKLEDAEVILVNTCCVRSKAEDKVFGLLGRLVELKSTNPRLLIAMGGCMVQQDGMAQKVKRRFPEIDIYFGTHNLHRVGKLIDEARERRRPLIEVWPSGTVIEGVPAKRSGGIKAWVAITYGCNNFCTYCIVPYVRGRERSRMPQDILREVREAVNAGYKEITLLGQNVNSYGKDLPDNISFTGLLLKLNEIEGLERVRFMTSHPRDCPDELIEVMAQATKVCEHLHLPVQSGSNRILERMNRGYTREYYLDLIEKFRKNVNGISITTDIIVGFPGETEDDFAATMDLVEKTRFDGAFTFVYTPRPGTPAAKMPGQVEEKTKKTRIEILIRRQNEITLENVNNEIGVIHEVLVEGKSKNDPEVISGRSRTNRLVVFPGPMGLKGKTVEVEITGGTLTHLRGRLIEKNLP